MLYHLCGRDKKTDMVCIQVGTADGWEQETEEMGRTSGYPKVSCLSSLLEMLVVGNAEKGGA